MRVWQIIFGLSLATALGRADEGADVARIHLEAIGGRARITAMQTLRMSGYVVLGEKRVKFTMLAARPDRVRLETTSDGRTLVHASDGVEPPWELDSNVSPPRYREMNEDAAKVFTADAEFDDPLVAGPARGFALDYAGEVEADGRKLLRVLVAKRLTENFYVLLDPNTYFIVQRVDERATPGGRKRKIVTSYDDFRPVDGVLLAHRVVLSADGRVQQEMIMERIETNVEVPAGAFSPPKPMMTPAEK